MNLVVSFIKNLFKKQAATPPHMVEWPEFIHAHVLADKVNKLIGHRKSPVNIAIYRNIQRHTYFLVSLTIPNCVGCAEQVNHLVVKQYASMKTIAPPIIFTFWKSSCCIIDGVQRLLAAKERGDRTILAYVPCGVKVTELKWLS